MADLFYILVSISSRTDNLLGLLGHRCVDVAIFALLGARIRIRQYYLVEIVERWDFWRLFLLRFDFLQISTSLGRQLI